MSSSGSRLRTRDKCAGRQAFCCIGVVAGEIDGWGALRVGSELAQRVPGDGWIGRDAICYLVEHEVLSIGSVTGKDVGEVAISDQDGQMMRSVTRRWEEEDVFAAGQREAGRKWPYREFREVDQARLEPFGPAVREIASNAACDAFGGLILTTDDEDF